jgi:hypothetical protein
MPNRGWIGITNVYADAYDVVWTQAVGTNVYIGTNTYVTEIQYGNTIGLNTNLVATNDWSFMPVDWRSIEAYEACAEREEITGSGGAGPLPIHFMRSEQENLDSLKTWLKGIVDTGLYADTTALTTNGDWHALPSIIVLTDTEALDNAGMPTNWFDYTPTRDLNGCGIGKGMIVTGLHTMITSDTNFLALPVFTNTVVDSWGDSQDVTGTNGQVVDVVATNTSILTGYTHLDYGWVRVTNLFAELTMTIHTPLYEDTPPAESTGAIDWNATSPTNAIGLEDCDEGVLDNTDPIVWADILTALAKDVTAGDFYDGMGRATNGTSLVGFGVRAWSHYTCLYDEGFDLDDYCAEPSLFYYHPTNIHVEAYSSRKRLTLDLDAITNKTFNAQWYLFTTDWDVEIHAVDYGTYNGQGIAPAETNWNLVNESIVWLTDVTTNLYLGSDAIGHTNIADIVGIAELTACGVTSNHGFQATSKKLVIDWAVAGGWQFR